MAGIVLIQEHQRRQKTSIKNMKALKIGLKLLYFSGVVLLIISNTKWFGQTKTIIPGVWSDISLIMLICSLIILGILKLKSRKAN
jgi:hypothetical protein